MKKVLAAYPKDVFKLSENTFRIVIPIGGDNILPLDERYLMIINYIDKHGSIDRKAVEELLDVKESRARDIIRDMVSMGLIYSFNDSKFTYGLQKKIFAKQG